MPSEQKCDDEQLAKAEEQGGEISDEIKKRLCLRERNRELLTAFQKIKSVRNAEDFFTLICIVRGVTFARELAEMIVRQSTPRGYIEAMEVREGRITYAQLLKTALIFLENTKPKKAPACLQEPSDRQQVQQSSSRRRLRDSLFASLYPREFAPLSDTDEEELFDDEQTEYAGLNTDNEQQHVDRDRKRKSKKPKRKSKDDWFEEAQKENARIEAQRFAELQLQQEQSAPKRQVILLTSLIIGIFAIYLFLAKEESPDSDDALTSAPRFGF